MAKDLIPTEQLEQFVANIIDASPKKGNAFYGVSFV